MKDEFIRLGRLEEVKDGDTYELLLDLGYDTFFSAHIRLKGIDVFEKHTPKGKDAIHFVTLWFAERKNLVWVKSYLNKNQNQDKSFARFVAEIYDLDGNDLADTLRAKGYEKNGVS